MVVFKGEYLQRIRFVDIYRVDCDLCIKLKEYCIQGNIHPCCQLANFRLGEFQCLKLSQFKHNFVWSNSRRGKTACKWIRVKITQDWYNSVYSSFQENQITHVCLTYDINVNCGEIILTLIYHSLAISSKLSFLIGLLIMVDK